MKSLILIICFSLSSCASNIDSISPEPISMPSTSNGNYTLVVEGFDWGAAASKVILSVTDSISNANGNNYNVQVNKTTPCQDLRPEEASGNLKVLFAYVSDPTGNKIAQGNHITLVLYAAPFEQLNSPIKYFFQNPKCQGNQWVNFNLSITNEITKEIWDTESDRIIPLVDDFDLSGKFSHNDVLLTYASFAPKNKKENRPLIIWLHGGGEGGTDTTIPLLANRAPNYASPEIQAYFEGAYVLVPQSPTFWMDNGEGQYTRGEVNDMYNESLMALIKDFVSNNPNIDPDRIYLGGCSNGGYMTLKLLMLYPDYFAAAFPSALAYHAKNLTPAKLERIKNIPIWFIHSADDHVTKPNETVIPTYLQLMEAGAQNVHLSYFDHVVDITNQFGGEDFHYNGHFSWIYSHTNKCQLDFDGKPVKIDGQSVSLMAWLAAQRRNR